MPKHRPGRRRFDRFRGDLLCEYFKHGSGQDWLERAGADYLDGGSSRDRLDGGAGGDTIFGQGGNDVITAIDGEVDSLFGGSGNDVAVADGDDVRVSVLRSI
jgi:Ca2+-binding RTX toxin-like protein